MGSITIYILRHTQKTATYLKISLGSRKWKLWNPAKPPVLGPPPPLPERDDNNKHPHQGIRWCQR